MTAVAVVVFLATQVPRRSLGDHARDPAADGPVLAYRELLPQGRRGAASRPDSAAAARAAREPRDRPDDDRTTLTEQALSTALSLGERVIAVAVAGDEDERDSIRRAWGRWNCAVPLEVLLDPHRSLVRSVLAYVQSMQADDRAVTVLIPEIVPRKRRHEILHNQRGRLLEAVLKARTDGVVVATLPFHLHD